MGDTVRKVYDHELYAKKAKENDAKAREESKLRAEAAAAGKKYHRAVTPDDLKDTSARESRIDVASRIGTVQLVQGGAAVGKRGKGAGFWCSVCDETYKDSHSLVEHYTSRRHLLASGETGEVKRASVADVRARLAYLSRLKREAQQEVVIDLDARLELSREREEQEREEKRRKRNEKRRKTKDGLGHPEIKMENDGIIS